MGIRIMVDLQVVTVTDSDKDTVICNFIYASCHLKDILGALSFDFILNTDTASVFSLQTPELSGCN
jgi:hypothetical protein